MAALESSLNLSYFHISSSSPNPQLQFPTKSNLAIRLPISTPKIIFKTPLPISAIQQELSVAEEHKEEEKSQKEDNKRKLFVLNLPWSFTVVDVKNFFGECGTVADVEIIKREDGKRGFAFVTMSSGDEALAVIKKFDSHAYVQQLESSRMKLSQLEQELQRARQQGIFISSSGEQSQSTNSSLLVGHYFSITIRLERTL